MEKHKSIKAEALLIVLEEFFKQNSIDTFGIATTDMFQEAPKGFHPLDVLPNAKSVIVFGRKHLSGTYFAEKSEPYSFIRNALSDQLNQTGMNLAYLIEKYGYYAVAIDSVGPSSKDKTGRSRGIISLKNSAVLAGLGSIGKNTLVINKTYGNLLWFGAVICTAPLNPSSYQVQNLCIDGCTKCIDACEVGALSYDSLFMDQQKCWNHAFNSSDEKMMINCFECRKVCPLKFGIL